MDDKLLEYSRKRDFDRTLEPEGNFNKSEEILRFVIQHHIARRDHYDLRLEWDGVLLSWAVPKGPSFNPQDKRLAVQVEEHPLEYRSFEGTIPKGEYGGGTVMLWDEGVWEPLADVDKGLREGMLKFALDGRRLKGKWALIRLNSKEGELRNNWLLLKEKDQYAKSDARVSEFNTSIRTGRTMEEIERGSEVKITRNPFDKADVQLARLAEAIPNGEGWLYELKYDGYRILAFAENNNVKLLTRNNHNYTDKFYSVASSLTDWAAGRAMVLDGEMAVIDSSGKTDFQALQSYMKNPNKQKLTYIIFDLLALDGVDLREQKLYQRKEALRELMKSAPPNLHYSQHVEGKGEECFKAACKLGMEGIVGKRADSKYTGTRNGDWIKIKCEKREEFVIAGYTLSNKKARGISSLLLGVYDNHELVYAGRAGTGLSRSDMEEFEKRFENLRREEAPFKITPKPRTDEKITWLEPELVAEIRYTEWTEDNLLRQASYKGLRVDKNAKDVRKESDDELPHEPVKPMDNNEESIVVKGIKITNPHKVIFDNPEITKADIAGYYQQVSKLMLPYVSHRILSVVRCPKGVAQACFYKKHPGPDNKGIVTIPVKTGDGESEDYFYIENELGLVSEAQMGTLEFHVWGSRIDNLEKPDMMVFDLDPDEGMSLDIVRQGVWDIKGILDELSLKSYLKTSGGKGYHVVVPFMPAVSWDVFYDFARGIAEVMEKKWPDRYTSNVRKVSRKNKIFIDWIRNGRGATSVAPYSIRSRKGARVSMPIAWDELESVEPDGIDMKNALLRIEREDPWKDFFQNNQQLKGV